MGLSRVDIPRLRGAVRKEGSDLVRRVAPKHDHDSVKERIHRAAKLLGWDQQRTEKIWRGLARRIEVWEMDQLRDWKSR